MLKITQEQLRQRLKTLPQELRDYFFSEKIADLVEHIGEKNHLNDLKQNELAKVIAYVLTGFIHQEDCRKEIQERLNVNPLIASELEKILIRDVFSPVAQYLEKSYLPAPVKTPAAQPVDSIIPSKPATLESLPKVTAPAPSATATPMPTAAAKPEALKVPFAPTVAPAAFAAIPNVPAPAIPAAQTAPVAQRISPLSFTKTSSVAPTAQPTPSTAGTSAIPQVTPATPKPMAFVTQTESQAAPVGNVPKFKIETPGTVSGSAFGGSSTPTFGSAPRPAKIELGFSSDTKKTPVPASVTIETQKSSVRYGAPTAPSFAQSMTGKEFSPGPKSPVSAPASAIPTPPAAPAKPEPPKPLL